MDSATLIYPLMKHVVLGPALRVAFRPRVEGRERVPASGPVILAANHLAFCDSFVLPLVMPRQVFFLGKHEYFTRPGAAGRAMAAFFRGVGAIAVDRSGGAAAQAALDAGARVLDAGGVFALHPEGTRSPDGRLYRGHTGVARLALRTGAPIVPVALAGTDRVQPPGRAVPRPGRVGVRIGRPLSPAGYGPDDARELTDAVMRAIHALSGQEYVDAYAPRRGTRPPKSGETRRAA
ncbi:lysophospholipid acyltransferase family protein [Actinomadura atramentaria]|uniref:lysophospholipid acyltransferase family protein n=1 Tax=Actinomadura atramentaria TaxID=1990 RepID=UPI00036AEA15|nr:lysophospholipid acyltransferase family protein [Actinomadura atramentaria]